MIFRGAETPICYFCVHATHNPGKTTVQCKKKGEVPEDFHCRKYQYDIFKKEVHKKKRLQLGKFNAEDFRLD